MDLRTMQRAMSLCLNLTPVVHQRKKERIKNVSKASGSFLSCFPQDCVFACTYQNPMRNKDKYIKHTHTLVYMPHKRIFPGSLVLSQSNPDAPTKLEQHYLLPHLLYGHNVVHNYK